MRIKRLVTLVAATCALASGANATTDLNGPLTIAKQGSFFVGGKNIQSDALSNLPAYAPSGTIAVDQVYVRYQEPVDANKTPIVLIHGCCLTGKTWESTPDGRMGWDELFVRKGFPTYVVDQASRGRSASNPSAIVAAKSGRAPTDQLPQIFGASQESAWVIFRFGPKYPEVFEGMQFPLEAQDEFWKQMVPDWRSALPALNPTVPALSELAQKLKGAVLVSHSQSGIYPFEVARLNSAGIRGIVAIEPGSCPAADSDMSALKGIPVLVLWGDYVDQAPRWAPRLKGCREFVEAARKAGVKAENVMLNDVGLPGASHMPMQDKHSIAIGEWLATWVDKNVTK